MKRIFKMYELSGSDACQERRKFMYFLKERDPEHLKKAIITRDILKKLFRNELKKEEVLDTLEKEFQTIAFCSPEQRRIQADDTANRILRYYNSESRIPKETEPKEISLFGKMTVITTPDFIFQSENILGEKEIEIVKVKCSRPDLTQKNADKDIGLYAMLEYAKDFVHKGEIAEITASYYYLTKANDSYSKSNPRFDLSFFDTKGGKNIVSISDTVDMCFDTQKKSSLTAKMETVVEEFLTGIPKEECTKADCEHCQIREICQYSDAPISLEKEPVVKNLQDMMLTSDQEKAIEYEQGICRINAGAGAGKTMVIALRVATLLNKGVKPEEIFLVTFTNSGANEMRSRIKLFVDDFGLDVEMEKLRIQTFHGFGNDIIQKEYEKLGFREKPELIDDVERSSIIVELLNQKTKALFYDPDGNKTESPILELDFRNFTFQSAYVNGALPMVKMIFTIMKENQYSASDIGEIRSKLDYYGNFISDSTLEQVARLYDEYDETLRERNLIEFADQETMLFEIIHQDPFYFESYGFKHIIVDEYQDTNETQMRMLKLLVECPTFTSLMVVGDDSQAIFGFRNTSPDFIISFPQYINKTVDDIYLLENYRSTPEIIAFANAVNERNVNRVQKKLRAMKPHGKEVIVRGFSKTDEEFRYVVDGIKEHLKHGRASEDIAVICFSKAELLKVGDMLTKEGIPSVLLNPEPYCDNSRVQAALSLFALFDDTDDTKDALIFSNARNRIYLPDATDEEVEKRIEEVQTLVAEIQSADTEEIAKGMLFRILESIDQDDEVYEKFLEKLRRRTYEKIFDYVKEFRLYGSQEAVRRMNDYPGVVLTTAHSSKGLEWPVCYNMISKYASKEVLENQKRCEEHRRLLFVSATRAREELYVTGQYIAYGKKGEYTYNPFLLEAFQAAGIHFSVEEYEKEKAAEEKEKGKKKK